VPPLAEIQRQLRRAIVGGDITTIVPILVGGKHPRERLAIHRRHYETSLVNAILGKFPATGWLAGTPLLREAAAAFVRQHPPTAPCIAEYGEDFPRFLSLFAGTESLLCLRWLSELEWHIGHASIAVDQPALTLQDLARHREQLADAVLTLQPGLRYLSNPWPVDELLTLYLRNAEPDAYSLSPAHVWLELCGSRGAFRYTRLEHAVFVFRWAVANGESIGAAAERALEADANFDIGGAFARFVTDGFVTACNP
jgi:hypothetical protein